MSKEVMLPNEIVEVLNERGKMWNDYDNAQSSAKRLDELAAKLPGGGAMEHITMLQGGSTAPQQLVQSITELENTYKEIDKHNTQIVQHEDEIKRIKSNATTMTILLVVGVLVVVVIAVVIVGSLIAAAASTL